jgi:hypothetical protein
MIVALYDTIVAIASRALFRGIGRKPAMRAANQAFRIALALAIACVLREVAIGDDASPKPLTPIEARKKVGEEILVEMTVRTAKDRLEKRGEIYLDAELDFRDEKNFATVINRDGVALFQSDGVKDFEEHFRGKTIRVKGVVTVVDDVPRIEVSDPKQVELVEKK